ncbi:IS1634 family transposase [Mycoplasma phocimorsus]|uniref:IS1634 family transposase n=1 Tax=Mycoplasma phocimorsus TaxID=3045839 RepID=UPI0024C033FF|nr:transposase [Mycoplasma phocimorsus]MDJ1647926.1 transposase [Mycoplasma phocimorsus]
MKIWRRIITHSIFRAKKDKEGHKNLINNFTKKQNSQGVVTADNIIGIKKYKFYKKAGKIEFALDYSKILEDEKFDGYYVYETTRMDLKAADIIEIYHKQWQIEENFRTLKSALRVRPVYVWTDKHIKGHFILCFILLIVQKYSIYLVNKYYKQNEEVNFMTNDKLIDAINSKLSCNEVLDGKIIRTFSINSSSNEKVKIYNDINRSIHL